MNFAFSHYTPERECQTKREWKTLVILKARKFECRTKFRIMQQLFLDFREAIQIENVTQNQKVSQEIYIQFLTTVWKNSENKATFVEWLLVLLDDKATVHEAIFLCHIRA